VAYRWRGTVGCSAADMITKSLKGPHRHPSLRLVRGVVGVMVGSGCCGCLVSNAGAVVRSSSRCAST